jgi:hypothetical protein
MLRDSSLFQFKHGDHVCIFYRSKDKLLELWDSASTMLTIFRRMFSSQCCRPTRCTCWNLKNLFIPASLWVSATMLLKSLPPRRSPTLFSIMWCSIDILEAWSAGGQRRIYKLRISSRRTGHVLQPDELESRFFGAGKNDEVLVGIADAHDEVATCLFYGIRVSPASCNRFRSGSRGRTPSVKVLWPACSFCS